MSAVSSGKDSFRCRCVLEAIKNNNSLDLDELFVESSVIYQKNGGNSILTRKDIKESIETLEKESGVIERKESDKYSYKPKANAV